MSASIYDCLKSLFCCLFLIFTTITAHNIQLAKLLIRLIFFSIFRSICMGVAEFGMTSSSMLGLALLLYSTNAQCMASHHIYAAKKSRSIYLIVSVINSSFTHHSRSHNSYTNPYTHTLQTKIHILCKRWAFYIMRILWLVY